MATERVGVPEKIRLLLNKVLGCEEWRLTNTTHKVEYNEKLTMGEYLLRLDKDKGVIASFKLYPMINCCGIAVSTQAHVVEFWRNKGLGTVLNQVRQDIARADGYSLLLCTDVGSNTYQRKILAHNGWRDLTSFINRRTKNEVFVSAINL